VPFVTVMLKTGLRQVRPRGPTTAVWPKACVLTKAVVPFRNAPLPCSGACPPQLTCRRCPQARASRCSRSPSRLRPTWPYRAPGRDHRWRRHRWRL